MTTTINGVEIEHGASTEIRVRGGVVEIGHGWIDPRQYQQAMMNAAYPPYYLNAGLQNAYNRGTTARSFIEEVLGI